jgi:hypothetical protein
MFMGVSVWTFLRSKTGEIFPVAQRAVDDFLANTGRLAADEEGFVRCAQVIVNLENRHVIEVLRVGFFQYRALDDGRIDPEHSREVMATVHEAAFGWLQLTKPPPGVVDAECKFAKRRLQHMSTWKPTQGELSKLRSLVNRKAGREIM